MNDEIVDMLIFDNDSELSSRFNIPIVVARILSQIYKHLNSNHYRYVLISRIENGFYSKKENYDDLANNYLSKKILLSEDHGFKILTTKCGLSEEEAMEFIQRYCKYNDNLKDLLSAELDVSNTNIEMRDMINEILEPFLESEEEKELAR